LEVPPGDFGVKAMKAMLKDLGIPFEEYADHEQLNGLLQKNYNEYMRRKVFLAGKVHDLVAILVKNLIIFLSEFFQKEELPCLVDLEHKGAQVLTPCGHLTCESCFKSDRDKRCPLCNEVVSMLTTELAKRAK